MALSAWQKVLKFARSTNILIGSISGLLVVITSALVMYEVIGRYYLRRSHIWSLELNVFLLIASTFLGASYTQMVRGHVGTDVLSMILPAKWERWRLHLSDIVSFALCAFVTVKTWQYAYMVWKDGWTTDSLWAPPLWIPMILIAGGMLLLTIEYIIQIADGFIDPEHKGETREPT